jgi:hypothetical protein
VKRLFAVLVLLTASGGVLHPQEVSLEYRVKAAYLYNFLRFVEWPVEPPSDPLTICVAGGRNPFGDVLEETIRGESVGGRPVTARVIRQPDDGCHVVFVPEGAAAGAYIRAADARPTLTVGESPDFIRMGGIVNFIREGTNVRFEIDPMTAERAGLRISSRLLQLARIPERS